jgi:hypothetical protein
MSEHDELARVRAELETMRRSEKELSDAYLRIRALVNAWDTQPGGIDRFAVTEQRVSALTRELADLKADDYDTRERMKLEVRARAAEAHLAQMREALEAATKFAREVNDEYIFTIRSAWGNTNAAVLLEKRNTLRAALAAAPTEQQTRGVHGETCRKVPHTNPAGGYLHGADDDRPYDVDGAKCCGRCHYAL